jgi:hypothetical protein
MKRISFSISSLLLAVLFIFLLASDQSSQKEDNPKPQRVAAVIINNDPTALHSGNVSAAMQACRKYQFDEIHTLGESNQMPSLQQVTSTLDKLQQEDVRIGLLYLTGHGMLYRKAGIPQGEACIMLRDRPLRIEHITSRIGQGPCVIYSDICFSPDLLNCLEQRLSGDFLMLTDKPLHHPQLSCRGCSAAFWESMENLAEGYSVEEISVEEISLRTSAEKAWRNNCSRGLRKVINTMLVREESQQNPAMSGEED